MRKAPLETAVLQIHLLTEDHARLFVAEFRREAALLAKGAKHRDTMAKARLTQVEIELGNLYQNLLAGLVSPVLQPMITEREAEKERLPTQLARAGKPCPTADILPHPVLLERFQQKVAMLRTSLDDDAVRTEASSILATLIESVTIYQGAEHGPEAEVVAKVSDLVAFASNENTRPSVGSDGCSVMLVAGTRISRERHSLAVAI